MNPGDYLIMKKNPNHFYAVKYCNDAGIFFGGICLYLKNKDDNTVILRVGNKDTEFGVRFLEDHFKKSHRINNLEKLGL
jgi:vancomycin resistance protein YoaR